MGAVGSHREDSLLTTGISYSGAKPNGKAKPESTKLEKPIQISVPAG